MTDKEKVDFYERWLMTLDNLNPEIRAKINGASIAFTGKYVAVNVHGLVSVEETDSRWAPIVKDDE